MNDSSDSAGRASSASTSTRIRGLTVDQQQVKNRLREKSILMNQRLASVVADSAFLDEQLEEFDEVADQEEQSENPYESTTRLPVSVELSSRKPTLAAGPRSDDLESAASGADIAKDLSLRERWKRYRLISGPDTLYNIIGNEAMERFSYFALKAVLTMYFTSVLGWSSATAVVAYSIFSSLGGFAAILGAISADGYLGRYKTILYFSLVYVSGSITLAVSSALKSAAGTVIALFLICLGGGSLKSAVSSFGADQYNSPEYEKIVRAANGGNPLSPAQKYREINSFFTAFYISINIGSVFSLLLIPPIRTNVNESTHSVQWGYCVSFAIPAFFLSFATLIFFSGRNRYHKVQPAGSVLTPVFFIIYKAMRNKWSKAAKTAENRDLHWIDRVRDQPGIDNSHLANAKALTRILPLFATIIPFWALYNQEGSTWVQQANKMDHGFIEPEQMHLLNPVLIVLLLPVFQNSIYPALPGLTSLRRIGLGMLFSASAFFCSYLVQRAIDFSKPAKISIWWQIPQFTLDVIAELLISVTGLTYAYSQAPPQMKSVVSAAWGLTNSFGNLLTAAGIGSLSKLFSADPYPEQKIILVFTSLMAVNVIIYSAVAYYSPDDNHQEKKNQEKNDGDQKKN